MAALALGLLALSVWQAVEASNLKRQAEAVAVRAGWKDFEAWTGGGPASEVSGDQAATAVAQSFAASSGAGAALDARARTAAEVEALLLDAIRERPGWVYHRYYLGIAALESPGQASRADGAFESAVAAAPGLDAPVERVAELRLTEWPRLDPAARASANGLLARACLDPAFVRRFFPLMSDRLGPAAAVAVLSSNEDVLDAARAASPGGEAGEALRARLPTPAR